MTTKFYAPDGTLQTTVVFSTTTTARFFTGVVDAGTVDLLVSVRGGPLTSDPSLVLLTGTTFTVPNPESFPNGLDLFSGENTVTVQAVPLVGTPGPIATTTAYLLNPSDVTGAFNPPTKISVERLDRGVRIDVRGVTDTRVTGYNFYASKDPGGGSVGYTRLNLYPVATGTATEEKSDLFTLTTKNPRVDSTPSFERAIVRQENASEVVLSTDVDSRVEIPDTVTTIETTVTLASVTSYTTYSFFHNRTANETDAPATIFVGEFASLNPTDPLYYVATAVYFDDATGVEYESYFSAEVVGSPVNVRIQTVPLPAVSRQKILETALYSIYRQDSGVAIQPGSVIRDTFLDPFTTEAERLRFLLDFYYRASSFDTLLQIDDPNGTGTSIEPSASAYKVALASAFFLSDPADVQPIIDAAFDKLSGNFSIQRPAGKRARGEARFYTPLTPTRTLPIPLGTIVTGNGIQFRTTRAAEIPLSGLASFYNPTTRLYSVTVPIEAVTVGSEGNLDRRQINQGAPYGLSVVNDAETFGGTNAYTNTQLAALARGALSSVDTGTQQGYYGTAVDVGGVIQAQVIEAGSPFMLRDIFPGTTRHVGGKVDVWTQGVQLAQVSDVFAFSYQQRRGVQFVVVGSPANYQFQAVDPGLSPTNPLSSMLNYPALGLGLRNATTGMDYDLTGVTVVGYNTIRLSTAVAQPPVTLSDVVLGDYRYRTGDKYTMSRQPVSYLASVTGEVTGALDQQVYYLVHPNSPLDVGRSTKAGDYLQINDVVDPGVVTPSGALVPVTNELHVLTGFYNESVFSLGADSLSVVVKDSTGVTTYRGPFDPSGTPDYEIVEGTATTPLAIRRTHDTTIPDGGAVLIDYDHDENFVVTYQTNLIPQVVQGDLNKTKHASADVLAKDAVQVPVDISATIVLRKGYPQSTADRGLRANLQYLVSNLRMGVPLRRSDVISTLGSTTGVSYVTVPLWTMARAIGSTVTMDTLGVSTLGDTFRVDAWSTASNATWLLHQELAAPTITGGGPVGAYRGVYQNDLPLTLQLSAPENLSGANGRAYIIGDGGLVIPGFTDDATLAAAGYVTPADIAAERQRRSQNRVLVSLAVGDAPQNHTYFATYVVGASRGDNDINPSGVEYIVLGDVTFTYTEDKQ